MPNVPRITVHTVVATNVAAVSLLVAGCSAGTAGGAAADPSTLSLAESAEYTTLNPLEYPLGITGKMYDGLVRVSENGTLTPGLASGMPIPDEDLITWTVPLRPGVTFSDGSAFDAEDVVAAYTAVRDPGYGSPLAADYEMVRSVAAPDPSTVVFELSYPYAGLPARLTLGIPAAEAIGESVADSPLVSAPVGTGPYRVAEWRRGDSMTLAAREDWWAGSVAVTTIHLTFVPDENSRAQRVRSGEIDGAQLSPLTAAALDGTAPGLEVVTNPSADFRAISLPSTLPFFTEPAVRVALNLGTDRGAMVDGILRGHGVAVSTPFTPAQGGAYEPAAAFEFDPDAAAVLLDAAGWPVGPNGVRVKDGTEFSFDLMYFANDTLRRDVAQSFASDMSKLGIEVRLEGVDRPHAVAGMRDKAFVLGGGDMPYDPDAQAYRVLHSSFAAYDENDAYSNPAMYTDAEVDRLLDAARREPDARIRDELYRELQNRLLENPPMVTAIALEHTYVARGLDNWEGRASVVEPHEHGVAWGPWWNVQEWTIR